MRGKAVFVDTNILVYAHDKKAGVKQKRAAAVVKDLWEEPESAIISVQVLQELLVNLLRKGVEYSEAQEIIQDFQVWEVVDNSKLVLNQGILEYKRYNLSVWDSFILAAARLADAETIFSEDLSTGQNYNGITAINPLV